MLTRLYRRSAKTHSFEECFYVELSRVLSNDEAHLLMWLIEAPETIVDGSTLFDDTNLVEIGPRLSVETPFSSSAVAICKSMGLPVHRIEKSRRYRYGPGLMVSSEYSANEIIQQFLDPMTQEV